MALALTPRLLRRGLELFAIISLAGVIVVLAVYGENVQAVGGALLHLHWGWLVVGLGLASMDWIGGGSRLWVVARHVHPGVRLKRSEEHTSELQSPYDLVCRLLLEKKKKQPKLKKNAHKRITLPATTPLDKPFTPVDHRNNSDVTNRHVARGRPVPTSIDCSLPSTD